jgi:hypothetical protein
MKINNSTLIFITLLLMLLLTRVNAQVSFQIDLLDDEQTYKVSLVSDETYEYPMNMVGGAQITIKIPANTDFEVSNLISLNNVEWVSNSRINSPSENAEYDYISFALSSRGTTGIPIVKDKKVALFTFSNISGCPGDIEILDNDEDPLMMPNTRQANLGNYISVGGVGGDAYLRKEENAKVECRTVAEDLAVNVQYGIISINPNPAVDWLNISYVVAGEADKIGELVFINFSGQIIDREYLESEEGNQMLEKNISSYPTGAYFIELYQKGNTRRKLGTYKFIKMED